jgi:hypothetical protein
MTHRTLSTHSLLVLAALISACTLPYRSYSTAAAQPRGLATRSLLNMILNMIDSAPLGGVEPWPLY